jgi:hypothetical protein
MNCNTNEEFSTSGRSGNIKLSLQQVNEFSYVAMRQGGMENPEQSLETFIAELNKQHVVPTGLLFLVFYKKPEGEKSGNPIWEIGLPTAEGTLVREPLRLKNWPYEKVMQSQSIQLYPPNQQNHPTLPEFLKSKDFASYPMVVLRIKDEVDSISFNNAFESEVWLPVNFYGNIAE